MRKFFTQLRRFDAYPKTTEDFSIKTFQGAASKCLKSNLEIIF